MEYVDINKFFNYFKDKNDNLKYKAITVDEFVEKHPLFKTILKSCLNRWGHKTLIIQFTNDDETIREVIHLFSNSHHYTISVHKDKYIGAVVDNRYSNIFERHHRGNDLKDGDYSLQTLCEILADITSWELIDIDVKPDVYKVTEKIIK